MKSQKFLDLGTWSINTTFGLIGIKRLIKSQDLMYNMRNTPCRNDNNRCSDQISYLVLAQYLAFFKTISCDFAMLVLHC